MSYLPREPFADLGQIDQEQCLIVEELCRVIAGAKRFQTCIEAGHAIQTVRRIHAEIKRDTIGYEGPSEASHVPPPDTQENEHE